MRFAHELCAKSVLKGDGAVTDSTGMNNNRDHGARPAGRTSIGPVVCAILFMTLDRISSCDGAA